MYCYMGTVTTKKLTPTKALSYINAVSGDENDFQWSSSISIINDNEQFVRIPYYGDIRLTIVNSACTTFLIIDSASQVSHCVFISL